MSLIVGGRPRTHNFAETLNFLLVGQTFGLNAYLVFGADRDPIGSSAGAFRYAQPIIRAPALEAEHVMLDAIYLMREQSAPQNGLSAAKRRGAQDRRALLRNGTAFSAVAPSQRPVRRPSIQNIRERYFDHIPPGPNTWTLNIQPLGRFHPHHHFLLARSTLPSSVARLQYRRCPSVRRFVDA
jgi:hypothetical protein